MPSFDHPLVIVRHGLTDWNVEGRLQGQRDIPLNARGRDQAAAVGRELVRTVPGITGFDFICSPLGRTRQTMEIMRGAMQLPPQDYAVDPRLLELTFGSWEGLTWRGVCERDPVQARGRELDKWGFVPPGGESYAMLTARISVWLEGLAGPTLAVTHGGVARVLLGLLAGVAQAELPRQDIAQGRALMFEGGGFRWI